jgi:hypothetical protein
MDSMAGQHWLTAGLVFVVNKWAGFWVLYIYIYIYIYIHELIRADSQA